MFSLLGTFIEVEQNYSSIYFGGQQNWNGINFNRSNYCRVFAHHPQPKKNSVLRKSNLSLSGTGLLYLATGLLIDLVDICNPLFITMII